MKKDIHPKMGTTKITCACSNALEIESTLGEKFAVEICSACHPFYTGEQRFLDQSGRIDRFMKKYSNFTKK